MNSLHRFIRIKEAFVAQNYLVNQGLMHFDVLAKIAQYGVDEKMWKGLCEVAAKHGFRQEDDKEQYADHAAAKLQDFCRAMMPTRNTE